MKKIIATIICCLTVVLTMISTSLVYEQGTGPTVPKERNISKFTNFQDDEIVPETCDPQPDGV